MSEILNGYESIVQTRKHIKSSERYETVETAKIVEVLETKGFQVYQASQSNVRKQSNVGFQKHMVWLTYESLRTAEGAPSIVIMNSHNRSSSLKFHIGYVRWACSNSLVGGADDSIAIRHSENWKDKANDFLSSYTDKVAKMNEEHQYMSMRTLTPIQLRTFLKEAIALRYDIKDILDVNELNLVRRVEDRGNDMYKTFNRIQEALLGGMFKRQTHSEVDGNIITSPYSKAKVITDNSKIITINQSLRKLALEIAA